MYGDMPSKPYTMQAAIVETELKTEDEKVVGMPIATPNITFDELTPSDRCRKIVEFLV